MLQSKARGSLSLFNACSILVSSTGSTGIFIIMSTLIRYTGSMAVTLIALVVAGLLNFSLSRCFTEVAVCLPNVGGPYLFQLHVFGSFAAFLFIWGFLFLVIVPAWGLLAYTAALYIVQPFFPRCIPPDAAVKLLSVCILVLIVLLNCLYPKYVNRVQTLLASTKMVASFIIVIAGAIRLAQGETGNFKDPFENTHLTAGNIAMSVLAGMFIYGGWQIITFLLEEMKKPAENLPKALGISFVIVVLQNVLTVAAYFVIMTPADMLKSDAVAVMFMDRVYRPLTPVISILVTTTSLSALNAIILGHSKTIYAAATRGHMPKVFATLNKKHCTPLAAMIFLSVLGIAVIVTGSLKQMIESVSFFAVYMSISVLLCLLALRWTQPQKERSVKVWLGTAVFQLILNAAVLGLGVYRNPVQMTIPIVVLGSSVPAYAVFILWKSKPLPVQKLIDYIMFVLHYTSRRRRKKLQFLELRHDNVISKFVLWQGAL
ncbi:hypothetical protein ACJMK2_010140 [Sinanodonta woodiana]|uniref:Amino acid transporter n=1 Tax=Sinanodonta woodiana TaxID=1069815 RepID=A0ABD3VEH9_SINWO